MRERRAFGMMNSECRIVLAGGAEMICASVAGHVLRLVCDTAAAHLWERAVVVTTDLHPFALLYTGFYRFTPIYTQKIKNHEARDYEHAGYWLYGHRSTLGGLK